MSKRYPGEIPTVLALSTPSTHEAGSFGKKKKKKKKRKILAISSPPMASPSQKNYIQPPHLPSLLPPRPIPPPASPPTPLLFPRHCSSHRTPNKSPSSLKTHRAPAAAFRGLFLTAVVRFGRLIITFVPCLCCLGFTSILCSPLLFAYYWVLSALSPYYPSACRKRSGKVPRYTYLIPPG